MSLLPEQLFPFFYYFSFHLRNLYFTCFWHNINSCQMHSFLPSNSQIRKIVLILRLTMDNIFHYATAEWRKNCRQEKCRDHGLEILNHYWCKTYIKIIKIKHLMISFNRFDKIKESHHWDNWIYVLAFKYKNI